MSEGLKKNRKKVLKTFKTKFERSKQNKNIKKTQPDRKIEKQEKVQNNYLKKV